MFTVIGIGYAAVALLTVGYSLLHLGGRRRERLDGADRTVLVAVAVLSSAAWVLFLPVYLVGWLGSSEARAFGARLRPLARSRREGPVHRVAH